LLLTWLGAAGFKLDTSEGATLLIDPYLSRPATASPQLPIQLADLFPVDEIFLTNGRFDHSMDTPALTKQTGAIVHATAPVCQRLANMGVSAHCLQIVASGHRKSLGSLTWQARPSQVNQLDSSLVLRALTRQPALLPEIRALDRQWPLGGIVAYGSKAKSINCNPILRSYRSNMNRKPRRPACIWRTCSNPNWSSCIIGMTISHRSVKQLI
jgi:hypothetical protein